MGSEWKQWWVASLTKENGVDMTSAIVIGCHLSGLGVIRALGAQGVYVIALSYDRTNLGSVSKYVSEHYLIPHPTTEAGAFVDYLLSRADAWCDSLIFDTDDLNRYAHPLVYSLKNPKGNLKRFCICHPDTAEKQQGRTTKTKNDNGAFTLLETWKYKPENKKEQCRKTQSGSTPQHNLQQYIYADCP